MTDNLKDLFEDDDREPIETDAAFDAWIAKAAPTLNAPGAAPRHEMWREIQAARATAAEAEKGVVPGVTPIRRAPWRLMSVIAAALLLGVALDRWALRPSTPSSVVSVPPTSAEFAPADSVYNDPARIYRLAASQTLTQAEALLTAYRANGPDERAALGGEQLAKWGGEVLGSTRLLIDSPAGSDPQLRALLEDLELVLVQLIQLSRGPVDPSDREHVNRALEGSDLLPRIRTAVPAGTPVSASSD